jgi:hypothetical protein
MPRAVKGANSKIHCCPKLKLMARNSREMVRPSKNQSLTSSDATVKQLILRMNERQHDLIIEVLSLPGGPRFELLDSMMLMVGSGR